jgi:hypothetical protein
MAKLPRGEITQHHDQPELYQAIGKFVYQFSQLEYSIRHLLSDLLELTPDQFYIVTASYDFATLCRVTSAFIHSLPECDEATEEKVTEIFKKCFRVNDARVRMVHGTWDDDGASHVSRASLKPRSYFASTAEVTNLTQDTKLCMNSIVDLIDGDVVVWARNVREILRDG